MHAFINQEFVDYDKASVHVSDLSIHRGYGVFDFLKVVDGQPVFMPRYIERFSQSAATLRLRLPMPAAELKKVVHELIQRNGLPGTTGVKLILTGGYSPDGYQPSPEANLIITQQQLTLPGEEVYEHGIRVITHDYVRELPAAKTINYSMGIWLLDKIRKAEAADVLYCQRGVVSEFPRCNFFLVKKNGAVVTSEKNVLHGVTRRHVLELAEQHYRSAEATITLDDIREAREAFLTSTTKRIIPIIKIDDIVIGQGKPGPVTQQLLQDLIRFEAGLQVTPPQPAEQDAALEDE